MRSADTAGVIEILAVTRTELGISHHLSINGYPRELALNYGSLEEYLAGGEFAEYESYAANLLSRNRWVQKMATDATSNENEAKRALAQL